MFDRWYHADDIIAHYPIAIYPRTGYPIAPSTLPPTVRLVDTGLYDVSSTQVREMIAEGKNIAELIPESIAQQAIENYKNMHD